MDIELFRDLIIIISGVLVIVAAIFVILVSYLVYRRINSILKSAKTTAARIEALTIIASDEIGKPLIQAAGLIQGLTCGIRTISKIFKKGGQKC
jgi:hypothetical protein